MRSSVKRGGLVHHRPGGSNVGEKSESERGLKSRQLPLSKASEQRLNKRKDRYQKWTGKKRSGVWVRGSVARDGIGKE